MKYSKEERIELGRKIHESGLSNLKAGKLFALSEESARRYRILYEQSQEQVRKKDAILMDNIFKKFLFSVCCKYVAIKLQAHTDSVLFCKFHKL